MKVIHSVVLVASSILLSMSAMAGTPAHGQPSHDTATAHTATAGKHNSHASPVDAATQEKVDAIKAQYREKIDALDAQLKSEQGNLKTLEHAHPRDASAVKQARSQVASTRAELRALRKQEHAEIAKVLAEAGHGRAHHNTASAKSSNSTTKQHKTAPEAK